MKRYQFKLKKEREEAGSGITNLSKKEFEKTLEKGFKIIYFKEII